MELRTPKNYVKGYKSFHFENLNLGELRLSRSC